jgi:hypothetical protein
MSSAIPGQEFGYDGFGSLYAEQIGAGDGGGAVTDPISAKEETDGENYVSINMPVSTMSDGSHDALLFKNVLLWYFKEDAARSGDPATLVHLAWLNIFYAASWRKAVIRYENFARAFMEKYKSLFPDSFSLIRNGGDGDDDDDGGDDEDEDEYGDVALGHAKSATGYSNLRDVARSDALAAGGERKRRFRRWDESEGAERALKMKTELTAFLSTRMSPTDYLFSDVDGPAWASTVFPSGPGNLGPSFESKMEASAEKLKVKERSMRTGGGGGGGGSAHDETDSYYVSLREKLDAKNEMEKLNGTAELGSFDDGASASTSASAGGKPSAVFTARLTRSLYSSSNKANVLGKPNLSAFFEYVKEQAVAEKNAVAEISEYFRAALSQPKQNQFVRGCRQNCTDYLFRAGYDNNWSFVGVANTITDDTSGKHAFGQRVITFPMVKATVKGEQDTFNIWGGTLTQSTKLYVMLRRRPLTEYAKKIAHSRASANFKVTSSPGGRGDVYEGHNSGTDKFDVSESQARAAWLHYGSYEFVPLHSEREILASDYEYINVFGQKELPIIQYIGTPKWPVREYDYNYSTRDLAIGICNRFTGMPPDVESAKIAMGSLPLVKILKGVRRTKS